MPQNIIKNLSIAAVLLAYCVVVLGAYVRLNHAGLGCPDWPGCYGKMIVPEPKAHDETLFPERPLEHGKAWKEMAHRYAAGGLGLLICALALCSWKFRKQSTQPLALPLLLVVLVIFQAALGMWTVTLLLKPVIVMAHLLGGFAILGLLFWLYLEQAWKNSRITMPGNPVLPWAIAALVRLVLQIALGGWTSANYAALACPDFPTCQGSWWPAMNFREGFVFWRGLGVDYEGGVLAGDARAAIHMSHRIGAFFTVLAVGAAAVRALCARIRKARITGGVLLFLLIMQISFGIANVLLSLPLPVAVAHNAVAALLLLTLLALLHQTVPPGVYRSQS